MLQIEAIGHLPTDAHASVMEVLDTLIIKYRTRRWDVSRTSAKASAPGKKTPAAKRAAHAVR